MLKPTHELYDEKLNSLIEEAASHPIESEEATAAMKNLEIFSKIQPLVTESKTKPTTKLGKLTARVGSALDNETTRTFIKAGGAFAGVALVAYSTIKRDHVLERTALQQANQRSV